mmetsp:Transcript_29233/g.47483  ORF Transcript_29233/g.47483 Transcript_29233/m.47483 type:complete len:259 (-) Transcript_29233:200-976(-)
MQLCDFLRPSNSLCSTSRAGASACTILLFDTFRIYPPSPLLPQSAVAASSWFLLLMISLVHGFEGLALRFRLSFFSCYLWHPTPLSVPARIAFLQRLGGGGGDVVESCLQFFVVTLKPLRHIKLFVRPSYDLKAAIIFRTAIEGPPQSKPRQRTRIDELLVGMHGNTPSVSFWLQNNLRLYYLWIRNVESPAKLPNFIAVAVLSERRDHPVKTMTDLLNRCLTTCSKANHLMSAVDEVSGRVLLLAFEWRLDSLHILL